MVHPCPYCTSYFGSEEALLKHCTDTHQVKVMMTKSDLPEGASTSLESSMTEIPYSALFRVGRCFREGHPIYGRNNWRQGGRTFVLERLNHAIAHIMKYAYRLETGNTDLFEGDDQLEDDLAKAIWGLMILCELERTNPESFPFIMTRRKREQANSMPVF